MTDFAEDVQKKLTDLTVITLFTVSCIDLLYNIVNIIIMINKDTDLFTHAQILVSFEIEHSMHRIMTIINLT